MSHLSKPGISIPALASLGWAACDPDGIRDQMSFAPGATPELSRPWWDLGNDDLTGDDPGLEILDGGHQVVDEPAAGGIADTLIGQPEHP